MMKLSYSLSFTWVRFLTPNISYFRFSTYKTKYKNQINIDWELEVLIHNMIPRKLPLLYWTNRLLMYSILVYHVISHSLKYIDFNKKIFFNFLKFFLSHLSHIAYDLFPNCNNDKDVVENYFNQLSLFFYIKLSCQSFHSYSLIILCTPIWKMLSYLLFLNVSLVKIYLHSRFICLLEYSLISPVNLFRRDVYILKYRRIETRERSSQSNSWHVERVTSRCPYGLLRGAY